MLSHCPQSDINFQYTLCYDYSQQNAAPHTVSSMPAAPYESRNPLPDTFSPLTVNPFLFLKSHDSYPKQEGDDNRRLSYHPDSAEAHLRKTIISHNC